MNARIKRLLDELAYYAQQLDTIGTILVDVVRAKLPYPQLAEETSEAYRLLTMDLVEIYNLLKRAHRHTYSLAAKGRNVSLEVLETAFISLRNAAELAEAKAKKLTRFPSREAKVAEQTSNILISLAENAAKMLVSEAERVGEWTVEWERKLGLRRWLR